jgi:hypothetical protein
MSSYLIEFRYNDAALNFFLKSNSILMPWQTRFTSSSQTINIKMPVCTEHPRLQTGRNKEALVQAVYNCLTTKRIIAQAKRQIDEYVDRHQTNPAWIISRLQMYWKTKATNVLIKGDAYFYAAGTAPVPTVKFPGARDNATVYAAPELHDIEPYMDDPRGVYLINRSKPGRPMEWVEIYKSGRVIETINTRIMEMAYTAAAIYWLNNDRKYAKFAFDLFDTYMTGMYYRHAPVDVAQGYVGTLTGLSAFEVIQEEPMLNHLTGIYDYLHEYLQQYAACKMPVYGEVFKKWADIQIDHGNAFNNWNLVQAKNVLNIALILDDDKHYKDSKGSQYYTNYILNTSSQRQRALKKFAVEGYDPLSGLWNESPGYSIGVLNDFAWFIDYFDRHYNLDLVAELPMLAKAVVGVAQYLFPNGYHSSFGDAQYGRVELHAAYRMVGNARKNNKPAQELLFSRYIKAIQQFYKERGWSTDEKNIEPGKTINLLLHPDEDFCINDCTAIDGINEFVSPLLYSSRVGYLVLRNGMHPKDGLMMAISGWEGNDLHAGGISMEIYGKGFVLAPGRTNQKSHSQEGIALKSAYPASGSTASHFPSVCYANVYFRAEAAGVEQERLTSILRTGDSTGYYIDFFHSRRRDGKDKIHDYFYHNLGQQLRVFDNYGSEMPLQNTDKLSFGGAHLFSSDGFYDKRSIITDKDFNAVFTLDIPDHETIQMNMWMKGAEGREIFAVKSPRSAAVDKMGLPVNIADLPMPAIIARQTGEAWKKPFAVVFEPSSDSQPPSIQSIQSFQPANASPGFTGLQIAGKKGDRQFVFADVEMKTELEYDNKFFCGSYGVISEWGDKLQFLFLGNGTMIGLGGYKITSKGGNLSAALEHRKSGWYIQCSAPIQVSVPLYLFGRDDRYELIINRNAFKGSASELNNIPVIVFDLPVLPYMKMELD